MNFDIGLICQLERMNFDFASLSHFANLYAWIFASIAHYCWSCDIIITFCSFLAEIKSIALNQRLGTVSDLQSCFSSMWTSTSSADNWLTLLIWCVTPTAGPRSSGSDLHRLLWNKLQSCLAALCWWRCSFIWCRLGVSVASVNHGGHTFTDPSLLIIT